MFDQEDKKYNDVDMETTIVDDTDSFEISEDNKVVKFDSGYEAARNRDRGISQNAIEDNQVFDKLDFGDEEYTPPKIPSENHQFQSWDEDVTISSKTLTQENVMPSKSKFDTIDMETDYYDDDDLDLVESERQRKLFDFDDEEETFFDKELVLEDTLEEKRKKKPISTGKVEDDYWKKLQKQHLKTNVKGAAGWHERVFAGDPEREKDLFNHDMNSAVNASTNKVNVPAVSIPTDFSYGEGEVVSGGEGASGEGSVGMSESLNENYSNVFSTLLKLLGFKITKDSNIYLLQDLCDKRNSFKCNNVEEIITNLKPYLDDYLIYSLQDSTGEKYSTYKDWCDWYSDDVSKKYPECKQDIKYCDLLCNHLKDLTI